MRLRQHLLAYQWLGSMEMSFLSFRGTAHSKSYLDSIGMLRHRAKADHCNSGIGRMMTLALFFGVSAVARSKSTPHRRQPLSATRGLPGQALQLTASSPVDRFAQGREPDHAASPAGSDTAKHGPDRSRGRPSGYRADQRFLRGQRRGRLPGTARLSICLWLSTRSSSRLSRVAGLLSSCSRWQRPARRQPVARGRLHRARASYRRSADFRMVSAAVLALAHGKRNLTICDVFFGVNTGFY